LSWTFLIFAYTLLVSGHQYSPGIAAAFYAYNRPSRRRDKHHRGRPML